MTNVSLLKQTAFHFAITCSYMMSSTSLGHSDGTIYTETLLDVFVQQGSLKYCNIYIIV